MSENGVFGRSWGGGVLSWLSRQAKAPPVLQRAHVSKGYLYPLFVIPYQIFIQYVNEFLDAYSCPVPVVKHLVFQTAKQPFAGGIVREASLFGHNAPIRPSPCGLSIRASSCCISAVGESRVPSARVLVFMFLPFISATVPPWRFFFRQA